MVNHIQRVTNVLKEMKAQGRINEINSIEGVERMLGVKIVDGSNLKNQQSQTILTQNKKGDNASQSTLKNPHSKRSSLLQILNENQMQTFHKRNKSVAQPNGLSPTYQHNTANQVSFGRLPLIRDESM